MKDECNALAAEIVDDLNKLYDETTGIGGFICGSAIKEQRGLVMITHGVGIQPPDEIEAAIEKAIVRVATDAGYADAQIARLAAKTSLVKSKADDLAAKMANAFSLLNQQICALEAVRASMMSESRLRKHSPNDPDVRRAVWAIADGKCFYCDHALARSSEDLGEHYREFHVDHIVAKANGGPDHISNYVPACDACNMAKSAKPFAEFYVSKRTKITVIEGGKDEPITAAR